MNVGGDKEMTAYICMRGRNSYTQLYTHTHTHTHTHACTHAHRMSHTLPPYIQTAVWVYTCTHWQCDLQKPLSVGVWLSLRYTELFMHNTFEQQHRANNGRECLIWHVYEMRFFHSKETVYTERAVPTVYESEYYCVCEREREQLCHT